MGRINFMARSIHEPDDDDVDGVCYQEMCSYSLELLGDGAWLTGCPLCGEQCWNLISKLEREEADREGFPESN